MKKLYLFVLFNIINLLSINQLYSDDLSHIHTKTSWITTLSLGPSWINPGNTQTLSLQSDLNNTYTASSHTSVISAGELFLGKQVLLTSLNKFQLQYGLALLGTSSAKLSGDIWVDASPNFNNFYYHYSIQHSHVAFKTKLITQEIFNIQAYFNGSVGVGFNRADQYNNQAKISEEIPPPFFTNQTTTSFAYTLGAGIQKQLSQHWIIGVGYLLTDWGLTKLGYAPGQTTLQTISMNHVYMNQLEFNMSYLL